MNGKQESGWFEKTRRSKVMNINNLVISFASYLGSLIKSQALWIRADTTESLGQKPSFQILNITFTNFFLKKDNLSYLSLEIWEDELSLLQKFTFLQKFEMKGQIFNLFITISKY